MNSYTFHINLYDLAFLGAIFIGLSFALLLYFNKTANRSANRFLALALATMILWMIRVLAIDLRLETYLPRWNWLPMQFLLALGPGVYFYVLKITRPRYKFGWRDLLHFSPLLLEQAALALEIRESARTGAATYGTHTFQQLNPILQLLIFISNMAYLNLSGKLIQNFYGRLQPVLMDRPRLEFRWLRRLLAATALLWLLWIGCAAVDYFGYRNPISTPVYYPFYIFFVVIIIWTAMAAFLRPQAAVMVQMGAPIKPPAPAELRAKGAWIKRAVEVNRYYQDPGLNLSSLAEKLGLPPHELSRVINTVFKKSFTDFINEYRVMAAARKMQDPAYDHITLLGIAFESGFNSKTTFNRIFKQMAGKSPTEYKNHLEKQRPSYNLGRHPRLEPLILNREPAQRWAHEKLNGNHMFRSYLKTAVRSLVRNKVYSIINIAGLAIGMACAFFILLWVTDETSYDRFHRDSGQLYQVWRNLTTDGKIDTWTSLPERAAEAMQKDYPEVTEVVATFLSQQFVVSLGNNNLRESGGYASPGFFQLFSFPFLQGNPETALQSPGNVVITAGTAARLFGPGWQAGGQVIGKSIMLDHKKEFMIAGVVRDVPGNSTIQFDVLMPMAAWLQQDEDRFRSWGFMACSIYARLQKGTSLQAFNAKVGDLMSKGGGWTNIQLFLQPFADVHLHGTYKNGQLAGGRIEYIHIFIAAGLFLLVIACINFMNLATARSAPRAREIGVRKTMGARRPSLIIQFILESTALTFIAFLLALAFVVIFLPLFNGLTGKNVSISDLNARFLLGMLGTSLIVGVVSGSYPALYLSSFRPANVLRGNLKQQPGNVSIRKALVVFQFTLSMLLTVSTIVVYRQLNYIRTINLGMERANLLYVPQEGALRNNSEAVIHELLRRPGIANVTTCSNNPLGESTNTLSVKWIGKPADNKQLFYIIFGNYDLVRTMQMQLAEGRDFTRTFGSDTMSYIVNEEAAGLIGKDVVGKMLQVYGNKGRIVGVVKNFSMTSLYSPIVPAILLLDPKNTRYLFVRAAPGKTKEALASLETVCKQFNPGYPFDYSFVDQQFEQAYRSESVMGTLANIFAIIALFISCLGLFGLAAYTAEQRTREIGVRKVLGASVLNIAVLLSKGFITLVAIAFVIAAPLAWLLMHNWLQDFVYRINIEWWMFLVAGLLAIAFALATISFQSIRAAMANPVKSLRTE